MVEKTVNLRDISPFQRDITCLPFAIIDNDFLMLEKLHAEISRKHGDYENRKLMLDELHDRHRLLSQNRATLASMYIRPVEDIQSNLYLTAIIEKEGSFYQTLVTDFIVKLNDSHARYTLDPVIFLLNEDQKTWKKVVKKEEETPAPKSAGPVAVSGASKPTVWRNPYAYRLPTN